MQATAIGRIIFKDSPNRLELVIPAKMNWLNVGLLGAVIIFWWFTGGNIAFNGLANHQQIEVYDWIWLCWGIAVILILLRNLWLMLAVKEIIVVEGDKLIIKKWGNLFVPNKIFKLSKARKFSLSETEDEDDSGGFWSSKDRLYVGSGHISFEYGKQIIRFGEGLTAEETERVLEVLRSKGIIKFAS